MKYYIIAGEASGDIHGSNLMKSLRRQDPDADFRCWGGDRMAEAGGHIVKHYRDLAFMGFAEVVAHLGTILSNLRLCKRDLSAYGPDVVILIDYPGFNMRMARYAHRKGFKVVYYIAPQVWAWRTGRIKKLKKHTDEIFTLLPFERKFYDAYRVPVHFEGNPLVDAVAAYSPDKDFLENFRKEDTRPCVLILPGSRRQEVGRIFPVMLEVASRIPGYRYVVAATRHIPEQVYREYLKEYPHVECVFDHTYDLFSIARAGMIKSGTSTLEAALFSLPQVVCYKVSPITYRIGWWVVNKEVRYISLVNLILDRPAVPELLQADLNPDRLERELRRILADTPDREAQLAEYRNLKSVMGNAGISDRVAASIISMFKHL